MHRYFRKDLCEWIYDEFLDFTAKMEGLTIREAHEKAQKSLWWEVPDSATFDSLLTGQVTAAAVE